jgi:hypothetical protein
LWLKLLGRDDGLSVGIDFIGRRTKLEEENPRIWADRSIWWCFRCPGRTSGGELVLRCSAERFDLFNNYMMRLADMHGAWYLRQWT